MVDRSMKYLIRVLEDVLVKVGNLYIPTDFIIMYIKEDPHVPIIVGIPLLCTVGIIIDVKRGINMLEKTIGFKMRKRME